MGLERLDIQAVRNLTGIKLTQLQAANIFYGDNGGGKTSVLESVYLLGMARSFRGAHIKPIINHKQDQCVVYGELRRGLTGKLSVGVSRDRQGGFEAHVGGKRVVSAAELAAQMPMQVINAESFNLLTGSPVDRRRYLDWGVFHVEHRYHETWRRFQRCIKQRNSLLRHGKISPAELTSWNREFVDTGDAIDAMRKAYLAVLAPAFGALLKRLSPQFGKTEIRYRRGWDASSGLNEALATSEKSDLEQGFTHIGPQRADLRLVYKGHDAGATMSRGQQKLVVCALKLAQGQLLGEKQGQTCVYLVDDLPSELDEGHCRRVCEVLAELKAQVFLSCVQREDIGKYWPQLASPAAMFHVEHGAIERVA